MISVKTAIKTTFPNIELNKGIRGSLLNRFYNTDYFKKHPEKFPYKSMRAIVKALEWPDSSNYQTIAEYPKNVAVDWGNWGDGVANDGKNWYFSQQESLMKFPIYSDLAVDDPINSKDLDWDDMPQLMNKGVEHLGDLDYYRDKGQSKGQLYVPCEGEGIQGVIALFDAKSLNYIVSSNPLTAQGGSAAWCAINPINGLLYSSEWIANSICVYDRAVLNTTNPYKGIFALELTLVGKLDLFDREGNPMQVVGIQGGAFSKNGHLYLVCDRAHWLRKTSEVLNSGIFGFDMMSGRRVMHKVVPYKPTWDPDEELQGITIWDGDSGEAPNIGGQIHLMMINVNILESDWVYFKHYRIAGGDKDRI